MSDRSGITRREALWLFQLGGVGAVLGGLAYGVSGSVRRFKSTCSLCVMHCGIEAEVRSDRIVRIEGDKKSKTRGFVCLHGYALKEIVHSKLRVSTPLARGPQGFSPISWTRAFSQIAERLSAIKERHGPEALWVQTGWPFVRHSMVPFLQRFCAEFGTPNFGTVASLCEASGRMGKALTTGANFWPDVRQARTLIVWGANPPVSSPPFGRAVRSMSRLRHNLIVIDPVRTSLADQATVFLQVRPGTDGLLALGMMRILIEEGLINEPFIQSNTTGFSDLSELVMAQDLETVSRTVGVELELIRKAARLYAKEGPSAIWDGLGIEHHENGVQSVRAIACLQAMAGYVGVDGGAVLHEDRAAPTPMTPKPVPKTPRAKPIGYDEFPLYHLFNRQAQGNLLADAILEDKPYPVRGLILFGSNLFVTSPDSQRLQRARERLDLLVAVDPFVSGSAELADFVLPASSFLERRGDDGVPPRGQSRSDYEITKGLAEALGFGAAFPWTSLAEALKAPHERYLEDPARSLEPLAGAAFPTPSGRIELASPTMERFGYDALPVYTPRRLEPNESYPFDLITGPRSMAFINSQFHQIPTIRDKSPTATAKAHPNTVRDLGLEDGAPVSVVSPIGTVVFTLELDPRIRPKTVVVPAGFGSANANLLSTAQGLDPVSGFPPFRSLVCRLEPAAETRPPGV